MWAGMLTVLMIVGALGQTPDAALGKAAREGDLARLKSLLDSGADPNRRDGNGNSPLLEALAAGQAAAARALVAAGANPNLASSGGRTPLIAAAIGGRVEIARLLIAAGADLNIAERGAGAPLEAAEREGDTEIGGRQGLRPAMEGRRLLRRRVVHRQERVSPARHRNRGLP